MPALFFPQISLIFQPRTLEPALLTAYLLRSILLFSSASKSHKTKINIHFENLKSFHRRKKKRSQDRKNLCCAKLLRRRKKVTWYMVSWCPGFLFYPGKGNFDFFWLKNSSFNIPNGCQTGKKEVYITDVHGWECQKATKLRAMKKMFTPW